MLSFIHWNVNPEIFKVGPFEIGSFEIGPFEVRYYGLFFAIAFILGFQIIKKMFNSEKVNSEWPDKLFMYIFIGTFIGARLGHVFFYGWKDYYSSHLGEIIKVWHGGLASHGGALGVIIAVGLFVWGITKKSMLTTVGIFLMIFVLVLNWSSIKGSPLFLQCILGIIVLAGIYFIPFRKLFYAEGTQHNRSMMWVFDRLVIVVALAGCFIRLGNLMNSEIYGVQTSLPWGFIFMHNGETIPKHPTQIYEALCYLTTFLIGSYLYWKTSIIKKEGFIMGLSLVLIFFSRFLIEFIKNDQEVFESTMTLNMGQLLSIPFIIGGILLMLYALRQPERTYLTPEKKN